MVRMAAVAETTDANDLKWRGQTDKQVAPANRTLSASPGEVHARLNIQVRTLAAAIEEVNDGRD